MFKSSIITAEVITGIFGLTSCGGPEGNQSSASDSSLRQKNSAFPAPKPPISIPTIPTLVKPTTTVPVAGTTATGACVTQTTDLGSAAKLPGVPTVSIPVPFGSTQKTTTTVRVTTTMPLNGCGVPSSVPTAASTSTSLKLPVVSIPSPKPTTKPFG